ncbi:hypothetical protein TWF106_008134 [Orbilia oligospora]|uniref:MYND-type domain-containing protein n=1 Tax=Orbilia oligospora TaxID=2813651 RepID=A0A7C8QLA3_ORBOL|nr:hypothetical protein TWF106_008134 [Orbilia oligospora]
MSSPSCYICRSPRSLIICPLCSAIEYCSDSHQSNDADRHFRECQRIQRALTAASRVEGQILAIRPAPPPNENGEYEVNKDDGTIYKFDTTGSVVIHNATIDPSDPIYDDIDEHPLETFHISNGAINADFLENGASAPQDGDEDFNVYSGTYDYDKEAYDHKDKKEIYDPFKNRIHLVNLYKPLDSSIYWTFVGKMNVSIRKHLLEAYLEVNTATAAKIALKLAADLHLFSRVSENGFTSATITALIRNGRDISCYNYIIDSQIDKFEYPSLLGVDSNLLVLRRIREPESLPRHDIIRDSARLFSEGQVSGDVDLEAATILLRLKCIRDLENLRNYNQISDWLQSELNFDLVERIREDIPDSETIREDRIFLRRDVQDVDTIIQQLEAWNEWSFESTTPRCNDFWEELIKTIEKGSVTWVSDDLNIGEEMRRRELIIYWKLWRDEPGAVDLIKKWLVKFAVAESVAD